MRTFMTFAASLVMAIAMLTAPNMVAQNRSRSTSGSTTRSTQQSGSTTRSSGSSSSSASRSSGTSGSTRSSGTVSQQDNRSRSTTGTATTQQDNRSRNNSGTSTRSSGSSSSSSTRSSGTSGSNRSSGTTTQQDNRNRSTTGSSTRSSGSSSSSVRSSGSTSGSSVRSSGSTGSSSSTRSSGNVQQDNRTSGSSTRSGSSAATGTVRASNASRGGLSGATSVDNNKPAQQQEPYRDNGYNYRYNDDFRVDDNHEMYRVAPRMREPMPWDRPGNFWGDHPHYYGYRITNLPPHWRRITHWGIDYYYYNGIYYRPYGGAYVICRPPFGTPLEAAIDRAILRALRFAYYCDTYRTYNTVFDNYNVIARQNLIIAQNNARIASQYSNYALNANRALSAYELANMLGLVQSYAYANSEYFYLDGVFYTISASGMYSTIVPPAGALVTSLPDDYEIIVMNGVEYYLVDNTVYRTTVFEGEPFLEVLGQMYGSLYNQYNIYR